MREHTFHEMIALGDFFASTFDLGEHRVQQVRCEIVHVRLCELRGRRQTTTYSSYVHFLINNIRSMVMAEYVYAT